MEGKLIKRGKDDYKLFINDAPYAQSKESPYKKLSHKNCEAVANGYDLGQTEWDVEIEMEFKDYDFNHETCINHYLDGCKDCYKEFLIPKLDENGCLILKRKK